MRTRLIDPLRRIDAKLEPARTRFAMELAHWGLPALALAGALFALSIILD